MATLNIRSQYVFIITLTVPKLAIVVKTVTTPFCMEKSNEQQKASSIFDLKKKNKSKGTKNIRRRKRFVFRDLKADICSASILARLACSATFWNITSSVSFSRTESSWSPSLAEMNKVINVFSQLNNFNLD